MDCWFYVSTSIIPPEKEHDAIDAIVSVSQPRNRNLGVTGALAFARGRFVQFLEGPEAGIRALRESISRDSRHADVVTLREGIQHTRRFEGWSLAYAGPASYVSRPIERALHTGVDMDVRDAAKLLHLLEQLTEDRPRSA